MKTANKSNKWNFIFQTKFLQLYNYTVFNDISKFSFQSKTHWMLICKIAAEDDNADNSGINYEDLCACLGRNIASRSTIASILDEGVDKKFFKKKPHETDKRVQLYRLGEEAINFLNQYVINHLKIFNSTLTDYTNYKKPSD